MVGLSLREKIKFLDFEPLLLCIEKPVDEVQAFGQDTSWISPRGGVLGMPIWEKTQIGVIYDALAVAHFNQQK